MLQKSRLRVRYHGGGVWDKICFSQCFKTVHTFVVLSLSSFSYWIFIYFIRLLDHHPKLKYLPVVRDPRLKWTLTLELHLSNDAASVMDAFPR